MTLALNQDYPLWDILLTMLMILGFGLVLWTLLVVFRDLFGRDDLSTWAKVGWLVAVLLFPLLGSLTYLIIRGPHLEQRGLRGGTATEVRMDAYSRSVTGEGGYHHIHETETKHDAMVGPWGHA